METRRRLYDSMLAEHLARWRQMAFVTGPRQVGKTTCCRTQSDGTHYLNWDNADDRRALLRGTATTASRLGLEQLAAKPPVVVFDELHKFAKWKAFLKGFFDTYGERTRILVTGSSRLDVYRRGGDSLMGRYFSYRMHPLSVAELLTTQLPEANAVVRQPAPLAATDYDALATFGGFPEPFIRRDERFRRRWAGLRLQQLLREDLRDVTRIHELGQLEVLALLLQERSGTQLVLAGLAEDVQVSVDTARRWLETLCAMHFGFLVRPWHKGITRSLRKEPKWYLRDWASLTDAGRRSETFVACHLLKAVEGWTDLGFGEFDLYYLRDKEKREVDFLVTRDRKPWFLVEAKTADTHLSPALSLFQKQTGARVALQVVLELPYVQADCFAAGATPIVVPARTFLSQLL